jgi:hypothetical protein
MEIPNSEKEPTTINVLIEKVSEKEPSTVNVLIENISEKEPSTVNVLIENISEKEQTTVNLLNKTDLETIKVDNKILLTNHTEKISDMLKDNNYIQTLLKKVTINIDTSTNVKVGNIISFLITNINGVLPLHNILKNLQEVFSDGVLDLYDVPTLVKIITELLNSNINSELLRNIKVSDVGLVLKLLIFILVEFKIIQSDKLDDKTIFKILDSSLELLETSLKLSNVKFNCSCFSWCK